MWIDIKDSLPELNVLVALININRIQSDPNGNYPVAKIGHLSEFGHLYWSCYGERGIELEGFTHWASLSPMPESFTNKFIPQEEQLLTEG